MKVVCIAASSLELGAIGNAAPKKTDVVFRTHQEAGFRSLNAVAELTHLRPVALLWGAPLKAAPNEAATLVHKYANPPAVTARTAEPVAGMRLHGQKNGPGVDVGSLTY